MFYNISMINLPYYDVELARGSEPAAENLQRIVELIRSVEIIDHALNGDLTLAMVRPSVGPDANRYGMSDIDAAEAIEEQIQGLAIASKFSFTFDPDTVEVFYEGPSQDSMRTNPPRHENGFANKWEEFKDLMVSGQSTALLLYAKGDAIPRWRDHLGHWNIEAARDPATIRGRMGVDNFNNLVHGSDSGESVVRELGLIASSIERRISG